MYYIYICVSSRSLFLFVVRRSSLIHTVVVVAVAGRHQRMFTRSKHYSTKRIRSACLDGWFCSVGRLRFGIGLAWPVWVLCAILARLSSSSSTPVVSYIRDCGELVQNVFVCICGYAVVVCVCVVHVLCCWDVCPYVADCFELSDFRKVLRSCFGFVCAGDVVNDDDDDVDWSSVSLLLLMVVMIYDSGDTDTQSDVFLSMIMMMMLMTMCCVFQSFFACVSSCVGDVIEYSLDTETVKCIKQSA